MKKMTLEEAQGCVGKGWAEIIKNLMSDLNDLGWNRDIQQVKEKFGMLRFYMGEGSREMHDRVDEAEELSGKTCETCGEPGTPSSDGGFWVKTICPKCRATRARRISIASSK